MATWQRTPVAVKILLNTALDVYSEEAVKQARTLSNPVLENLQKVREDCLVVADACCGHLKGAAKLALVPLPPGALTCRSVACASACSLFAYSPCSFCFVKAILVCSLWFFSVPLEALHLPPFLF